MHLWWKNQFRIKISRRGDNASFSPSRRKVVVIVVYRDDNTARSNEALRDALFPRHFAASHTYIHIYSAGIYFIYRNGTLQAVRDTLLSQHTVCFGETRELEIKIGGRLTRDERRNITPSLGTGGVSLGAIQCTTLRQIPAFQIVPFSFIHI